MRYTGNWFSNSLFVVGVALGFLCCYYVVMGVYRVVAWKWTSGIITGTVVKDGIEDYSIHEQAEFIHPKGDTIQVIAFSGVSEEDDARTGEVTILYNPTNPHEATILQFRDYLIVFLLPFALFLSWLGWPFERVRAIPNPRR